MMPHNLRTTKVNQTIRTVLNGLFYRLESLSKSSHPGWHTIGKHRNEIGRVRSRIMGVIASQYPEDQIPDAVAVVYDHTIYRVDYVEGTMKVMGTMPRHLPSETDLMRVLEVG